jgi:hypothetical protein
MISKWDSITRDENEKHMKKWKKIATYTLIVNMMHPGLSALIKLNIRNLMLNTKNHVPVYSTDINAKQIPNVIM